MTNSFKCYGSPDVVLRCNLTLRPPGVFWTMDANGKPSFSWFVFTAVATSLRDLNILFQSNKFWTVGSTKDLSWYTRALRKWQGKCRRKLNYSLIVTLKIVISKNKWKSQFLFIWEFETLQAACFSLQVRMITEGNVRSLHVFWLIIFPNSVNRHETFFYGRRNKTAYLIVPHF